MIRYVGGVAVHLRANPLTISFTLSRHLHRSLSSSTAVSESNVGSGSSVVVKKVTMPTFRSVLEDLRIRVREADFISFDLEMTGVKSTPWRDSFEFDRSDVRYLKVKDSADKFAVVQFGLCTFRWDASLGSFIAHPLNFYLFPRKEQSVDGPSDEFLCQTTSLSFLAKYQFDFNACIYEGITYLSKAQEGEALQRLRSAYENELASYSRDSEECVEMPAVRTADLLFTERMKIRFFEWRETMSKYPQHSMLDGDHCVPNVESKFIFFKMHPAIMLNGFTSHQLKLIQLVLRKHFKEFLYVGINDENCTSQKLVVFTDSTVDKASLMAVTFLFASREETLFSYDSPSITCKDVPQENVYISTVRLCLINLLTTQKEIKEDRLRIEKAKIHSAVGFRHVIDLLISEDKLIVGHNCFLDITHVCAKFIGPLPSSLKEFALLVNKMFPKVIDTKHLINTNHAIQYLMKKSRKSLSSAFSLLCSSNNAECQNSSLAFSFVKVDVQPDEMGSACWNSGAKHEAGFDAFMTGCIFAQSCKHLGIKFEQGSVITDMAENDKLKSYLNILYPTWNSGTTIDLETGSEMPISGYKHKYPKIDFTNIVLIWGFSSKIKPKDVEECMSKALGKDSVVSVFFLDRTAALVQFSRMKLVNYFLSLKDELEKDNAGFISVLHPLSKLMEGGNTRAGGYNVYKEICCSPMSKHLFADQAEAIGFRWRTKMAPVSPEDSVLEYQSSSKNEQPHLSLQEMLSYL